MASGVLLYFLGIVSATSEKGHWPYSELAGVSECANKTISQEFLRKPLKKVFTNLQFLFQVSKQCQRISAAFMQSHLMILVTVSG